MGERSLPWSGTVQGDCGPYSSDEWAELWRYIIGLASHRANVGVLLGSGNSGVEGLKVRATGPVSANIEVAAGAAMVNGTNYINDATAALTIAANGSGNPRIDTVILRKDFSAQTVRLAILQGTAAVTPSPPALTQTPNVLWEIPLADIAVANGFLSIADADITPRAEPANAADGVYLDMVLNNSGVELNTGDVVIWDTGADRAVTTTTSPSNPLIAGAWVGRTANGGYGRLQVGGIALVRVNGAVSTRAALLATSSTARQAEVVTGGVGVFAQALETTAGAGFCLAHLNTVIRGASPVRFTQTADQSVNNTTTETTIFGAGVGSLSLPANELVAGKSIRITMGGYFSLVTGTLTFRIYLGATVIELTATATTGAQATDNFTMTVTMTCRATGVTGSVVGTGLVFLTQSVNNTFGGSIMGLTANRAAQVVNTTIVQAINATVQWSALNAGNLFTSQTGLVEVL